MRNPLTLGDVLNSYLTTRCPWADVWEQQQPQIDRADVAFRVAFKFCGIWLKWSLATAIKNGADVIGV